MLRAFCDKLNDGIMEIKKSLYKYYYYIMALCIVSSIHIDFVKIYNSKFDRIVNFDHIMTQLTELCKDPFFFYVKLWILICVSICTPL